jgi:hypothetical protein
LRHGALDGADPAEVAAFWRQYEAAVRTHSAMKITLARLLTKLERMNLVIEESRAALGPLDRRHEELRQDLLELDSRLHGSRARQEPGEKFDPTIQDRLFAVIRGVGRSTYGPTATHRESLEIAVREMGPLRERLIQGQEAVSALARELVEAGGPWIEGELLPPLPPVPR